MLQLLQTTEGFKFLELLSEHGAFALWAGAATVGCYILYKQNQKLHADAKEAMQKVTELVTKTLAVIQTNEKNMEQHAANMQKINELLFVLKESQVHWKGIPDLKSKVETLIKILEMKHGMA